MPAIHPRSRRQVRWAFAAERRGEFPRGKAREWAHRWKCWTWAASRGPLPRDCADAMELLDKMLRQGAKPPKMIPIRAYAAIQKKRRRAA